MGDVGFQYSVRKLDFKNNYRKDVPVRSLAGASFYVGAGWILCGEVCGVSRWVLCGFRIRFYVRFYLNFMLLLCFFLLYFIMYLMRLSKGPFINYMFLSNLLLILRTIDSLIA